jgi:hypothetical protein
LKSIHLPLAPLALVLLGLSACTWIELTEEAESVNVMATAPSGCERLGSTQSMTKSDIASIDRKREKIAIELETLARNAAARMGGDTIVPESDVSDHGEQEFGIFHCNKQAG